MQVVDNLLVLHNLDSKDSQVYDFRVNDYNRPMLKRNLEVDSALVNKGAYMSDVVFAEELE